MARPQLLVKPGLNAWRLLRTDRDGATEAQIPRTTAAVMRYFLTGYPFPEPGFPEVQLIPIRPNEWRFDDVRPLKLVEVSRKSGPALPRGELLADRMNVPDTVPSVSASKPWWVVVWFWWRGPEKSIDYPGVRSGWLWPSWELNGADWVLDRAVWVPEGVQQDPGAESWSSAVKDETEAAFLRKTGHLGDLLVTGGQGLAVAALLYLLLSRSRRR